jgi:hypothetical protein
MWEFVLLDLDGYRRGRGWICLLIPNFAFFMGSLLVWSEVKDAGGWSCVACKAEGACYQR